MPLASSGRAVGNVSRASVDTSAVASAIGVRRRPQSSRVDSCRTPKSAAVVPTAGSWRFGRLSTPRLLVTIQAPSRGCVPPRCCGFQTSLPWSTRNCGTSNSAMLAVRAGAESKLSTPALAVVVDYWRLRRRDCMPPRCRSVEGSPSRCGRQGDFYSTPTMQNRKPQGRVSQSQEEDQAVIHCQDEHQPANDRAQNQHQAGGFPVTMSTKTTTKQSERAPKRRWRARGDEHRDSLVVVAAILRA